MTFRLREDEHPTGNGALGEEHLHQVRQPHPREGLHRVRTRPLWVSTGYREIENKRVISLSFRVFPNFPNLAILTSKILHKAGREEDIFT